MANFETILSGIAGLVWGPPLLILLFGTHIFLCFRLRFIQRYIFDAIKISLERKKEGAGDISQFGALTTALAATIGTGNIVGVATAVASGGPMYVLERGMNCRWLGMIFAFFTAIAAFGIGNMVQANSIAQMAKETFHISPWITGIIITVLTAVVILGGVKSIARTCEKLVPFMAIFYVAGCLILLTLKFETLPDTIMLILKSAFTGQAAVGGFLGAGMKEAIRFGIARGLFSNESGLGSAPIIAAAAQTKNPVRQALVSSTGTFWDTVVVCLITGLVIVNSGEWVGGLNGAALTKKAFEDFPLIGPVLLTVGLLTFVFSTILGWSYYGEKAAEYLWGTKAIPIYRYLWVVAVMAGSVVQLSVVWNFADIANALMAIPNIISLLALQHVIVEETRLHLWNKQTI